MTIYRCFIHVVISHLNSLQLQKTVSLRADFPTRLSISRDWKFLESRRQGLENYLQAVIHEGSEELPVEVYKFFDVGPITQQNSNEYTPLYLCLQLNCT